MSKKNDDVVKWVTLSDGRHIPITESEGREKKVDDTKAKEKSTAKETTKTSTTESLKNKFDELRSKHKNVLTRSSEESGKAFDNFENYKKYVDQDLMDLKWNKANQEERDKIATGFLEDYLYDNEDLTPEDILDLEDVMEDNNYHTEANLLEDLYKKSQENKENVQNLLKEGKGIEKALDPKTPVKTYSTNFNLASPLGDIDQAQEYLSEDDMTKYFDDKDSFKDAVVSMDWVLDDESSGHVEVKTNRELTSQEQKDLLDWIDGQNSDGLGEGFEQQDFANAYWDPDTGDGPYTYSEAEQIIADKINDVEPDDYFDYIDESDMDNAIDTYLDDSQTLEETWENSKDDNLIDELIEFEDTGDGTVERAIERVTGESVPEDMTASDFLAGNGVDIRDDVATELWTDMADYEKKDFLRGSSVSNEIEDGIKEEMMSDPEGYFDWDTIGRAKEEYAQDHYYTDIDDWGAMSSIRRSGDFEVSDIEPKANTEGLKDALKGDVIRDAGIEPGSREESQLNELYDTTEGDSDDDWDEFLEELKTGRNKNMNYNEWKANKDRSALEQKYKDSGVYTDKEIADMMNEDDYLRDRIDRDTYEKRKGNFGEEMASDTPEKRAERKAWREEQGKEPDAYKDSMITSRNDKEVIKDLEQRKEQLASNKGNYTPESYKEQEDGLNAGIEYAKNRERQLQKEYMSIPEEERVKAYEEGKNWKDLVKEKEKSNPTRIRGKGVDKEEYDVLGESTDSMGEKIYKVNDNGEEKWVQGEFFEKVNNKPSKTNMSITEGDLEEYNAERKGNDGIDSTYGMDPSEWKKVEKQHKQALDDIDQKERDQLDELFQQKRSKKINDQQYAKKQQEIHEEWQKEYNRELAKRYPDMMKNSLNEHEYPESVKQSIMEGINESPFAPTEDDFKDMKDWGYNNIDEPIESKSYDKQYIRLANDDGINQSLSNIASTEKGGTKEAQEYVENLIKANNSDPQKLADALNKDKRIFNSNWEVVDNNYSGGVQVSQYNPFTNKTTKENYDKIYTLTSTDKLGNKDVLNVYVGSEGQSANDYTPKYLYDVGYVPETKALKQANKNNLYNINKTMPDGYELGDNDVEGLRDIGSPTVSYTMSDDRYYNLSKEERKALDKITSNNREAEKLEIENTNIINTKSSRKDWKQHLGEAGKHTHEKKNGKGYYDELSATDKAKIMKNDQKIEKLKQDSIKQAEILDKGPTYGKYPLGTSSSKKTKITSNIGGTLSAKESSAGVIVVDNGKVLLVEHNDGRFGFPKGHTKIGESELESAQRELLEETNYNAKIKKGVRIPTQYSTKKGETKSEVYFVGTPRGNNSIATNTDELKNAKFYTIEEAREKLKDYGNLVQVLDRATGTSKAKLELEKEKRTYKTVSDLEQYYKSLGYSNAIALKMAKADIRKRKSK